MRLLYVLFSLAIGLVLMGCGGSTGMLEDGRSVSTTYSISGTTLEENSDPVYGYMGLWDVTFSHGEQPDWIEAIDSNGEFSFTNLPAGHYYYIDVWACSHDVEGWDTSISPYINDLSRNVTINFTAIMP